MNVVVVPVAVLNMNKAKNSNGNIVVLNKGNGKMTKNMASGKY